MDIKMVNQEYERLKHLRKQIGFALESIEVKSSYYYNNVLDPHLCEESPEENNELQEKDKEFIEDEIYKLYAGQKHYINLLENIPIVESKN